MAALTPHPNFARFFSVLSGPTAPARAPFAGMVFRSSLPKWMSAPYRMTGVGSVLSGGRWNVRSLMPAMNFGQDAAVAQAEADAKAVRLGWPASSLSPLTRVAFAVSLQAVLDLTDAAVRKALGVTQRELTDCDWEAEQAAGREPVTQAVARAAFETLAEGLVVPSARLRGGGNVVVFTTHLQIGSSVTPQNAGHIPFVHGLP